LRRAGLDAGVPRSAIRARVVDAMGKGYGYPTADGESARRLAGEHGVTLDPTYGAKAFSFLQRRSPDIQRAIFWHTFPSL
jgi:1-aminocyclopropane-1-carboxylate deaminase/D-cysteine desulfhydrase-like pyridoxal-dependent ACC family enzyme